MRMDATVIGRIGKTPELRTTPSGKSVTTVSLAEDRFIPRAKDEDKQRITVWHQLECWGPLALHATRRLAKGTLVLFVFRIDYQLVQVAGDADAEPIARKFPVLIGRSFDILSRPATHEAGEEILQEEES